MIYNKDDILLYAEDDSVTVVTVIQDDGGGLGTVLVERYAESELLSSEVEDEWPIDESYTDFIYGLSSRDIERLRNI